jgi:hypothetical protein
MSRKKFKKNAEKKRWKKMETLQWVSASGLYVCFSSVAPLLNEKLLRSGVGARAQRDVSPGRDGARVWNMTLESRQFTVSGAVLCEGSGGPLSRPAARFPPNGRGTRR